MRGGAISMRTSSLHRVGSRVTADLASTAKGGRAALLPLRGVPWDPLPTHVLDEAKRAVDMRISSPSQGLIELRQAVARKLKRENGIDYDFETEILITNGAMQALNLALQALLDPGDEAVMFTPCFFFDGIVSLSGGVPVYAPLDKKGGFQLRPEKLEEKMRGRTRVILFNTPLNPTGYVASMEDLLSLKRIAETHDLLVISDESYEKLVYDGASHVSIASLPGMKDRTITIQSFSKSYGLSSFRIGYLAGCPELIGPATKLLEWNMLYCNHVVQRAALAALTGPQDWVEDITHKFQRSRDILCERLSGQRSISFTRPRGGPFIFLDVSRVGIPLQDFCSTLALDYGIPATPGPAFHDADHIRIPFGAPAEVIGKAADALEAALSAAEGTQGTESASVEPRKG